MGNMIERAILWMVCSAICCSGLADSQEKPFRDIYPDTWVATDSLGRTMPDFPAVGPVKEDQRRVVGIFYITWHDDGKTKLKSPYGGDVTKILAADPDARLDARHPLWAEGAYHWGNPTMGFFNALMTEWMSGGRSGGYSLCWHKAAMGDTLKIKVPCKRAGRYRLLVGTTRGPASARVAVSVEDQTCPEPVDLRQKDVAYAPEVDLGTFDFTDGDNEVSFKTLPMTNGEPNPFNFLSLDYLRLVPSE